LSGIVAGISVLPATLTILLRHKLPLPLTLALGHISQVGFAVALATTDQCAGHSTQLLGKVRANQKRHARRDKRVLSSCHLLYTCKCRVDSRRAHTLLELVAVLAIPRGAEIKAVDPTAHQH